jgi:protein-L-isoaspartate(D-aspartate) O-methyltransferase
MNVFQEAERKARAMQAIFPCCPRAKRITIVVAALLVAAACAGPREKETGGAREQSAASTATASALREDFWTVQRRQMVERQIRARGVTDPAVLKALLKVERHLFVPEPYRIESYEDGPLPIGEEQTISQPYIVGLMTELLKPKPGQKILEVGTGSGYQAAVLAEIVGEVYTIEIVESLGRGAAERLKAMGYKNVHVRIGDGYEGWPEAVPFDGIIVTAAPDHVPQPLVEQLKEGGRLVVPVGSWDQRLEVLTKTKNGMERSPSIPVRFVPMTGKAREARLGR